MDDYTTATRDWLDDRYRLTDRAGVYFAHQPIYGFGVPPSERGLIPRYIRTKAILDAVASFRPASFIDVGGSEGYTAWLVRDLLGVDAHHTDLSTVACERARSIFGLESRPADVHDLPFEDNSFDVVACSETIEHVSDPDKAVSELLRVARLGVVLTVPHEDVHDDDHDHGPHAHIQEFDLGSFDHLSTDGRVVSSFPLVHPTSRILGAFVDGQRRPTNQRSAAKRLGFKLFNKVAPLTSRSTGRRAAAALIRSDRGRCERTGQYEALLATIRHRGVDVDPTVPAPSIERILEMSVPFVHLGAPYRSMGAGAAEDRQHGLAEQEQVQAD